MKAHEAAQPSKPWPSSGQANDGEVAGGQPPFVPDYELLCRVGIGAYGDVWLARSTLGAYRAVKVVSRGSFEHDQPFEREFKGIQRFEPISLTHESQVKILHVGRNEEAGYFYYVMELADDANPECRMRNAGTTLTRPADTLSHPMGEGRGEGLRYSYVPRTLKHELQTRGRLPVDECVQIGLALTTALAHLHDHGLIHRDVKPSNIIFVNGVPKLADIGLVTDVEATRSFVGTEGFIPPEGPGTVSADLYSLGKVLYEISMGRSRLDFPALPANWDDLPEEDQARLREFNEVLVKACESDVSRRYSSARRMHDDLGLLQRGKSVRQKRTAEQRWAMTKKLALAAAAAALVVATLLFSNARHYAPDPEAVRLYKEGQWHYNQLTPEAHVKAYKYLTQAVQVDPKFVQPYGELMALYTWLMMPGITNEQIRLQKVREIAGKALAINPNSPEGHTALSWCRFLERDWRGAEDEIRRAIKLDPDFALAHDIYCFYLSMQCRPREAQLEGQRAVELRPPDSERATAIIASWPFMAERRFDLAIVQLQRVLDLEPKFSFGLTYLGVCYLAQSNFVAAINTFKTCALQSAADSDRVLAIFREVRDAYDTQGEKGYFRKWIELMLAESSLPEAERVLSSNVGPDLAGAYARLGEKDKALKELEEHFDEPQVWHQIKFIPEYDSLHDEPRFQTLVKRAGLEP